MRKTSNWQLWKLAVLGYAALLAGAAQASSAAAWAEHEQAVVTACTAASGLQSAKAVGKVLEYEDALGVSALLITGRYPQPHMGKKRGRMLCVFHKQTGKAYVSDAAELLPQRPAKAKR